MSTPKLIDDLGRPVRLDRKLASGGEGAVYSLPNDADRVAKVYHKPPTAQTAEKLTLMVGLARPTLLSIAAWPSALLRAAGSRQVAGFVMPRLNDFQPIQHLYNPVQRLKHFARAGWNFQIRAACNLAAAFDEVHKTGCLVGDVNQGNAFVSQQALVRLIDCDSFQVRSGGKQFLCEVGVPHYTPPELQGKSFRGVVRTENHDRFGLAVLIFQLLFVGRHPYAGLFNGRGDPSFEQLIAEFRFAHGPRSHSWGMSPPPHTPTSIDFPPTLFGLFRKAFEPGSEAGNRPRPADWIPELRQLEASLAECADDAGHRYWRGTSRCTWCRLAANGGPEYYFGVAGDLTSFDVDEAKLQAVIRRLNAIPLVAMPRARSLPVSSVAPDPDPIPQSAVEAKTMKTAVTAGFVLCIAALPLGFFREFFAVVGGLGSLVFAIWLAILLWLSPWQRELRRRSTARVSARRKVSVLEYEWDQIVVEYGKTYQKAVRAVTQQVDELRNLTDQYRKELDSLAAVYRSAAKDRHLRLHSIADANIPKIGTARKQTLAANGVYTAADVEWDRIRQIPGFGDTFTASIVAWKDEVLRTFKFDPRNAVSPARQRETAARYRQLEKSYMHEIETRLSAMTALAPQHRKELDRLFPRLQEAISAERQAEVDLALMRDT